MHALHNIRLHHILFLAFTLISAVPVLILSAWVQRSALESEVDAVEEKHLLLAYNLTNGLTQYVISIKSALNTVEKYINNDQSVELLGGMLNTLGVEFVWVMDKKGRDQSPDTLQSQLQRERIPNNIGKLLSPYMEQAEASHDDTVFSGVLYDSRDESVLYIIKALDDGFLVAMMNTRFFQSMQKKVVFGERGHAAIVDQYGHTLAHPSEVWRKTRKDITVLPPVQLMTEGKTGVSRFYSPVMKADMVAGYTVEAQTGWGVMIPQPFDELVDNASGARFFAIVITLLGITTAGLISWWLARFMCRPLAAVAESAQLAASGDVMKAIRSMPHFAPIELRELTNSFNLMVEEINTKNKEMAATTARLASAQRIAKLGNWEWDLNQNILWCSDEVFRIFGFEAQSFIATFDHFFGMVHPDDQGYVKELFDQARNEHISFGVDHRVVLKDGRIKYVHQEVEFHGVAGSHSGRLTGTVHEITERIKYEEQLIKQAQFDELTGLANRALYFDHLAKVISVSKREQQLVAVLFIDLDNFKVVNDTHGHIIGDSLLKQAATRIADIVREADTVARIGGDEFAIILHHIKRPHDASVVAEKVIAQLSEAFQIDDVEAFVGASIGITIYPADADDAMSMHRNADIAMYRSKEEGKNTFQFFTSKMNEQVHERLSLAHDLRGALDNNEFDVYFQPIIDTATEMVSSAEALVRWIHPQKGFIPPDKFISVAEETGIINPLGEWVFRKACEQASSWQAAHGNDVRVSVNLSPRQIKQGLTRDIIIDILSETGLNSSDLTFEITESMVMADTDQSIAWMKQIKELGVMMSIDDFGTGYSSLSYLKRLPVDILKIDRAFISGVGTNREDDSLITAIVAMARSLNLCVVAEGVETVEQLEFLRDLGCEKIQGYLYSKPLPVDEFKSYLKERHKPV